MVTNGAIPLTLLENYQGRYGAPGFMSAFKGFQRDVYQETGVWLTWGNAADSVYRTLAWQEYRYAHRPPAAAYPGTSNHGLGMAGDLGNYYRVAHSTLVRIGKRWSLYFDTASELWHIVYRGAPNYTTTAGGGGTPITPTQQAAESENRPMTDLIYYVTLASKDGKIPANAMYYQECPGAPIFPLTGGKPFNVGSNASIYEYQAFAARYAAIPDAANFGQFSAARYPISGDGMQLLIALRGPTTKPTGNFA